jgi:hypothetical protein
MIEFIATQLGIPISNARILLDQWLDTAMNTLSEGKPVTLDGLGTFTYENNELKFKADAGLELDVNRAYAGLEPLPEDKLGPAKLTESDFDDPFMEIIAPKYLDPNRDAEPESVEEEVEASGDEVREIHELPILETPLEEPLHETPLEEPLQDEPAPKPIPLATKSPNLMPWVVAALILVVVLVGGWYAVQWYGSTLETEMASTGTSENMTATAEEPTSEPVAAEPTSPIATPGFGLRGAVNPLEGRVYSIVVHSLPTEAQSQAECAKIVALGLRCSVVPAERNGATTFRVGIGQFESVESANRSVGELPERYQTPGNFFITRIQ